MKKFFLKSLIICILGIQCLSDVVAADEAVNPSRPRQCYSCEGINCQRSSRLNATTDCSDLLDICITVFENFAVVAKGCYMDVAENYRQKCDGRNSPECFKCFGKLCNNKGREDFKCIECNDNLKCATDTSAMKAIQCPIPTATNSYCFVRKNDDGNIERGCMVHLINQMRCLNEKNCSLCLSSDGIACNSYRIDDSSTSSSSSSVNRSKASNFAFSACLFACLLGGIMFLVTILELFR